MFVDISDDIPASPSWFDVERVAVSEAILKAGVDTLEITVDGRFVPWFHARAPDGVLKFTHPNDATLQEQSLGVAARAAAWIFHSPRFGGPNVDELEARLSAAIAAGATNYSSYVEELRGALTDALCEVLRADGRLEIIHLAFGHAEEEAASRPPS